MNEPQDEINKMTLTIERLSKENEELKKQVSHLGDMIEFYKDVHNELKEAIESYLERLPSE